MVSRKNMDMTEMRTLRDPFNPKTGEFKDNIRIGPPQKMNTTRDELTFAIDMLAVLTWSFAELAKFYETDSEREVWKAAIAETSRLIESCQKNLENCGGRHV
jgi:hypothetical protein